jgi:RimJ/RimL family protein N-acetyltransferase
MSQTLNFPDEVPEFFGDTIFLREITEGDIPAWFERASDRESAVLAGDPIPESIEMGFQWLHRHPERFRQQTGIRWAIVPKGFNCINGKTAIVPSPIDAPDASRP